MAWSSSRFPRTPRAVAAAVLGFGALVGAPAGADVEGLDPSSAQVRAGGELVQSVKVRGRGCLGPTAPPGITVRFLKRTCGGKSVEWATEFAVSTTAETAPGTYAVISELDDATGTPTEPVFALTVLPAYGTTTSTTTTATTTRTSTTPTSTTVASTDLSATPGPTALPPGQPAGADSTPVGDGSAQGAGGVGQPVGTTTAGSSRPAVGTTTGPATGPAAGRGPGVPVAVGGDAAAAPAPDGPRFVSLASLVAAEPTAGERLFLPFAGDALRSCVPLEAPCADPAGGLVLVPAGGVDVAWTAAEQGANAPVRTPPTKDMPALPAVGREPPDPDEATFLLPVLRAGTGAAKVVVVARRLEAASGLVAGPNGTRAVLPTAAGAALPPPSASPRVVFGEPDLVTDEELSSRTPVVVVFGSGQMPVLYGIQPDPAWKLKQSFLPLFGPGSVPLLAERVDGTLGLLLPRPPDLVLAAPEASLATTEALDDGLRRTNRNGALVATLFGLVLAVVVGTVAAHRLR